jgi:hypothetical protein
MSLPLPLPFLSMAQEAAIGSGLGTEAARSNASHIPGTIGNRGNAPISRIKNLSALCVLCDLCVSKPAMRANPYN